MPRRSPAPKAEAARGDETATEVVSPDAPDIVAMNADWLAAAAAARDGDQHARHAITELLLETGDHPATWAAVVDLLAACGDAAVDVISGAAAEPKVLQRLRRAALLHGAAPTVVATVEQVLLAVVERRRLASVCEDLRSSGDPTVASRAAVFAARFRLDDLRSGVPAVGMNDQLQRLAAVAPALRTWADTALAQTPADPAVIAVIDEGRSWMAGLLGDLARRLVTALQSLFALSTPDPSSWSARRTGLERSLRSWLEVADVLGDHPDRARVAGALEASRRAGDEWLQTTLSAVASAKRSVHRDRDLWQSLASNGAVVAGVSVVLARSSGSAGSAALLLAATAVVAGLVQRQRLAHPLMWLTRFHPPPNPISA
jgi:hypothetical protein